MVLGHLLHHETEGGDVVGAAHRLVVLEVDLVLARRHLVVRRLHLEAHRLQHDHDVAPALLPLVHRGEVEIAADVVGLEQRVAVGVLLEEEELGLRAGHHGVAQLLGLLDLPLERHARAARERRAVRQVDVADHAGDLGAVRVGPRIDPEGLVVGRQQHVRLLDAGEPLDRRAVEHDLAVQRLLELAARDLDVLDDSHDVRELQTHEADALFIGRLQDLVSVHE